MFAHAIGVSFDTLRRAVISVINSGTSGIGCVSTNRVGVASGTGCRRRTSLALRAGRLVFTFGSAATVNEIRLRRRDIGMRGIKQETVSIPFS